MWAWLVFTIVMFTLALCIWNRSQRLNSRIKAVEIRLEKCVQAKKKQPISSPTHIGGYLSFAKEKSYG